MKCSSVPALLINLELVKARSIRDLVLSVFQVVLLIY